MCAGLNEADRIEALLNKDGFKEWGVVIYRYTYQNNSDWEKFMARFMNEVSGHLEFYNGLDLLDTFTPTVLEDRSFEGATVATLREHFNQWAKTSLKEEQGVSENYCALTGRYSFFITVDQEAMESVLNVPEECELDETGFVRMVYGEWEPEEMKRTLRMAVSLSQRRSPLRGVPYTMSVGWKCPGVG
jgi:hypothetical protein